MNPEKKAEKKKKSNTRGMILACLGFCLIHLLIRSGRVS